MPERDRRLLQERKQKLIDAAVPEALAAPIGGMIFLTAALDIADLSENCRTPLDHTARVYYGVGAQFAFDERRASANRLPAETTWQKQAVEAMIDDLLALQADLAKRILTSHYAAQADPLAAWSTANAAALGFAKPLIRDLRAATTPDLAMLVVAMVDV